MTKELEALELLCEKVCKDEREMEYKRIIETALKDYEELKKLKLLPYPKANDEEYRRSVIKRLQALEIIKEKGVDVVWVLETKNVEEYNDSLCIYSSLTQEEYDLLKEVLL